MQKDLADKTKAWDTILGSLGNKGKDMRTWSKRDGDGNYFHAESSGKIIIFSQSKETPPCKIDFPRPITYEDFERVANMFNQYLTREVKRKDVKGWNTSYIISLIARLL